MEIWSWVPRFFFESRIQSTSTFAVKMSAKSAGQLLSRCASCRHNTINSFIRLASSPRVRPARTPVHRSCRRSYAEAALSKAIQDGQRDTIIDEAESKELATPNAERRELPEQDSQDSRPWYLREQIHEAPVNPILERQKLPDLPPNPPESLQAILEHLSVDIGLDYLSVLDLRALHPPPALGANLIMLVGTTRSEKHLHVAADRFSRWLRATYKLHPYADGLLGRNELKIKLRRKNKKAKARGLRGLPPGANEDYGISTGWICVNVGLMDAKHKQATLEMEVEEAKESDNGSMGFEMEVEEAQENDNEVMGFGTEADGVTLVVQMLTKEKREELDLEGLWKGALRRQQRKEERELRALQENSEVTPEDSQAPVGTTTLRPVDASPMFNSLQPATGILEQRRAFHTGSRHRQSQDSVASNVHSREQTTAMSKPLDATTEASRSSPSQAVAANLQQLEKSLRHLRTLPTAEARTALGAGADDQSSTEFLRTFHAAFPLFPTLKHWIMRFRLVSLALALGHPGYREAHILDLLDDMQTSNVAVPPTLFELVLAAVAEPRGPGAAAFPEDQAAATATYRRDFRRALAALEPLSLRGASFLTEPVAASLYQLANRERLLGDGRNIVGELAASNLARALAAAQLGPRTVTAHVDVMAGLAAAKRWADYWRYWGAFPARMERRPQPLYEALLRHAAATQHVDFCADVLADWTPEMELELPKVTITADLARAVMECIKVVVPRFERLGERETRRDLPWAELWNQCVHGLELPPEDVGDGYVRVVDLTQFAESLEEEVERNMTKTMLSKGEQPFGVSRDTVRSISYPEKQAYDSEESHPTGEGWSEAAESLWQPPGAKPTYPAMA